MLIILSTSLKGSLLQLNCVIRANHAEKIKSPSLAVMLMLTALCVCVCGAGGGTVALTNVEMIF